MKDHKQLFSLINNIDAPICQERAISRRGVLLGITGLVVAGCTPNPATSSFPTNGTSHASPTTTGASTAESKTHAPSPTSPSPAVGTTLLTYTGHSGNVSAVGWSPDGRCIASAGFDKTVQVWDVTSGKALHIYHGHAMQVGALAWSPDSKYIVSGSSDIDQKSKNTLQVWKMDTGQKLVTYTGHTDSITAVVWSPDGTRIISASRDGTVQVWEPLSGKRLLTLPMSTSLPVQGLAISPDGQNIVAGLSSLSNGPLPRTIKIYQSQTGNKVLTYHDTTKGAQALTWSPDGKSIAMSQGLSNIQIWDAANGKDTTSLQAVNASVLALVWSPDGKYLASGGGSTQAVGIDNQAQIWDMTRKKVTIYLGHKLPVSSLSWSPDGTRVVSASWDHTVQVWRAV